ncbi:MAG: YggS family pyridoxal phosphate-dependent enzyme [Lachnospirales bacterium]
MIKDNYEYIMNSIKNSCEISNRDINEITVVGVTKTISVERIQELVNLGIKNLGENKVQEFLEKHEKIMGDVKWHFIGHLQTNKVKFIVGKVDLIHSVDSVKLMEKINSEAKKINFIQKILIEVNVAEEESKFGINAEDLRSLLEKAEELSNIRVCGLMTIAPYVENPLENKEIFISLRKLAIDKLAKNSDNMDRMVLSMGMSNDYNVAIESGATLVRIGRSFFGERIKLK